MTLRAVGLACLLSILLSRSAFAEAGDADTERTRSKDTSAEQSGQTPPDEEQTKPMLRLSPAGDEETCRETPTDGQDILGVSPVANPCGNAVSDQPAVDDRAETKQAVDRASSEDKPPRFVLEPSVGGGGFYGSDALNGSLLWAFRVAVRAWEDLFVFASLDGSTMPWLSHEQAVTGAILGLRYELPLGFFVGAGGGVAWLWLRKGEYQESTVGYEVNGHVGYRLDVLSWLAVQAQGVIVLRELNGVYVDFGALAGPQVRF